jgi:hypothetical protein
LNLEVKTARSVGGLDGSHNDGIDCVLLWTSQTLVEFCCSKLEVEEVLHHTKNIMAGLGTLNAAKQEQA